MKYPTNYFKNPWSKIDKTKTCWNWKGYTSNGYGKMRVGGRWVRAHRAMYEIIVGKIPPGLIACHKCDNTKCVNPKHIFLGTKRDNAVDSVTKGRWGDRRNFGSRNGRSKLSDLEVKEIRGSYDGNYGSVAILAKKYAVAWSTVDNIIKGITWGRS